MGVAAERFVLADESWPARVRCMQLVACTNLRDDGHPHQKRGRDTERFTD